MLLNKSLCFNCSNKNLCKYCENIISNMAIEFSIEKCEYYITSNETQLTNKSVAPFKSTVIPTKNINETYPDYNKIYKNEPNNTPPEGSLLKPEGVTILPLGVEKRNCMVCGKETFVTNLQNCSDCGIEICSECGYSNVDIINNKTSITCDKCFAGITPGEKELSAWDLEQYTEDEESKNKESVEEVDLDVSRKNQSRIKRSNSKSKNT